MAEFKETREEIKNSMRSDIPDLFFLSHVEKQVMIACILVRSRSFLLFSTYMLLGDMVFPFIKEFSGKTIKIPPKWVVAKYVRYARVYHQLRGKDLRDQKLISKVAKANRVRVHQVIPIYNKVQRSLDYFNQWIQKEFNLVEYNRNPQSESPNSEGFDDLDRELGEHDGEPPKAGG